MPINYVIEESRHFTRTVVSGVVTSGEILAHLQTTRRENALPYAELIDARGVTAPYLSLSEIWKAAGMIRAFKGLEDFGPRAVVVGNQIIYASVRIFANLIADFSPIKVFREPELAEAWLVSHTKPELVNPPVLAANQ